jgi:hypothetical protein
MALRGAALAASVALASGHGSLVIPPARNTHQNVDPAAMFTPSPDVGSAPGVLSPNATTGSSGGGCCAGGAWSATMIYLLVFLSYFRT